MTKRQDAPEFIRYQKMIINCPNYKGLPYKTKKDGSPAWVASRKTKIGKERIKWANKKANELGIQAKSPNKAREKVMFKIHPTKWKVCQICGHKMSLRFIYPNKNLIKDMKKDHIINKLSKYDSIYDIFNKLNNNENKIQKLKDILIHKSHINYTVDSSIKDIINKVEKKCRIQGKTILGPGAMYNFPDRFDGYHSYNRCCRSTSDLGRSPLNLKSYSIDRRAYEKWNDGNINAANDLMHYIDKKFGNKGGSADHIGPISLGFKHSPFNLREISSKANSTKRDKLYGNTINLIIKREQKYNVNLMSSYGKLLWNYIKLLFKNGYNSSIDKIIYKDILKQNVNNVMYILWHVYVHCKLGKSFLINYYINSKNKFYKYKYHFHNLNDLRNCKKSIWRKSKNKMKVFNRFKRIAFSSLIQYHNKSNRELRPCINEVTKNNLIKFETKLNSNNHNNKKVQAVITTWNKVINNNQKFLKNKLKTRININS